MTVHHGPPDAEHRRPITTENLRAVRPRSWFVSSLRVGTSAEDLARGSHSTRMRMLMMMEAKEGRGPKGSEEDRPWNLVFRQLPQEEDFWRTQVYGPALTWLAHGEERQRPQRSTMPSATFAMDWRQSSRRKRRKREGDKEDKDDRRKGRRRMRRKIEVMDVKDRRVHWQTTSERGPSCSFTTTPEQRGMS